MGQDLTQQLRELVDRQDLTNRAQEEMASYWREADPEDVDWAFTLQELAVEFGSQTLCFRSGRHSVEAPYIATNLQLYVFAYHVGWYELLTDLEGQVIEQTDTIFDDFFAAGRAAPLIERSRGRAAGDPREWIGLVGLRSIAGNDFFPDWAAGGFTTVVALATGPEGYRRRVEQYFREHGAEIQETDDVELLSERLRKSGPVEDEIFELAGKLSSLQPVLHSRQMYSYGPESEESR